MRFIKNLKLAYWATFKPNLFDAFVSLYVAKKEYEKKRKSHSKAMAEKWAFNRAKVRFDTLLKG